MNFFRFHVRESPAFAWAPCNFLCRTAMHDAPIWIWGIFFCGGGDCISWARVPRKSEFWVQLGYVEVLWIKRWVWVSKLGSQQWYQKWKMIQIFRLLRKLVFKCSWSANRSSEFEDDVKSLVWENCLAVMLKVQSDGDISEFYPHGAFGPTR